MDFSLTEEQELIVQSYADYMESENWETYFHECDEAHEYPLRWVKGLCELGFDQIMLPEEHGGLGLEQPTVTLMAIYEVLGKYGARLFRKVAVLKICGVISSRGKYNIYSAAVDMVHSLA